jgi:hypothetical protein
LHATGLSREPAKRMPERRFPPPWSVEEQDACLVVIDSAGQKHWLFLLQRRAGPTIGRQAAHEGRGAAHRGERRQAARAIEKALN